MIEFFKKFFKKEQKKASERGMDELLGIFKDKIASIKDDIYEFGGFYPEIIKLFERLNKSLIKLKNAESSEEVYPQLKSAVNNARNNVLKIKTPGIKEPKNFEDFKELNKLLAQFLDNINSIKPNYIEIINILYKNEIRDLISDIKEIKLIEDGFNEKMNNKIKKMEKNEKICFNLNLLKNQLIELNNLKEKNEKSINEINELKNFKSIKEKEIEKIKNSEEYKKFQKIKNEINEINEKIKLSKTDFLNKFNSIKKALKIYYYGAESKEFNNLFQNPFLIKNERMLEILNNVKNLILKEKIRLKSSKREKTLKAIENINENLIKEFKNEYKNLKDLKVKKESEFKDTKIDDLSQIEAEISRIWNYINFLEKGINDNLEEIKKQKEIFESTKKETEELIFKNLNEKIFIKI